MAKLSPVTKFVSSVNACLNEYPDLKEVEGWDLERLAQSLIEPIDRSLYDVSVDVEPVRIESFEVRDSTLGLEAFEQDRVAVLILAGGEGTRLGQRKIDTVVPSLGMYSRQLRLLMTRLTGSGKNFAPPVWIGTRKEDSKDLFLGTVVTGGLDRVYELEQPTWCCQNQVHELMTSPVGVPQLHPTGTFDLLRRLHRDPRYVAWHATGEERYVYVVSVDNVLANPDIASLGSHIASGAQVSWEVVERNQTDVDLFTGDHGLVWHEGMMVAVRPAEVPNVASSTLKYTVTDTAIVNSSALRTVANQLTIAYASRTSVKDGRSFGHLERDIQDITRTTSSRYVEVPRDVRYLPMRTKSDIERLKDLSLGSTVDGG